MTLGEKIKELRVENGMTQEAFAEKLGISRSAIAKWETNKGTPEIGSLKLISRMFHVSVDQLLDDENNEVPPTLEENHVMREYIGFYCDIDLVGWNDGVYNALILEEDKDFVFYQKMENQTAVYGILGKKYIRTIQKCSPGAANVNGVRIDRRYFCNKHVLLEVAHQEGFFKGFFDFSNDDYLDVVIMNFDHAKVELSVGRMVSIDRITKIEEIIQ